MPLDHTLTEVGVKRGCRRPLPGGITRRRGRGPLDVRRVDVPGKTARTVCQVTPSRLLLTFYTRSLMNLLK